MAAVYVAGETRSFARDIGFEPRTTPIESPQSNGMAEAFVRTTNGLRRPPASDTRTTWTLRHGRCNKGKVGFSPFVISKG